MDCPASGLNEKDPVSKVLAEARGCANDLSLRLANWWSALIPVSSEAPAKVADPSTPARPESKSVEAVRGSWYSDKELRRISSTSYFSDISQGDADQREIIIFLLGKKYTITAQDFIEGKQSSLDQLLDDFRSQPWFTYRHHFPQIKPAAFTTDSGWGCMLRTGQCLLAQALLRHDLGKGWALCDLDPDAKEKYIKV